MDHSTTDELIAHRDLDTLCYEIIEACKQYMLGCAVREFQCDGSMCIYSNVVGREFRIHAKRTESQLRSQTESINLEVSFPADDLRYRDAHDPNTVHSIMAYRYNGVPLIETLLKIFLHPGPNTYLPEFNYHQATFVGTTVHDRWSSNTGFCYHIPRLDTGFSRETFQHKITEVRNSRAVLDEPQVIPLEIQEQERLFAAIKRSATDLYAELAGERARVEVIGRNDVSQLQWNLQHIPVENRTFAWSWLSALTGEVREIRNTGRIVTMWRAKLTDDWASPVNQYYANLYSKQLEVLVNHVAQMLSAPLLEKDPGWVTNTGEANKDHIDYRDGYHTFFVTMG